MSIWGKRVDAWFDAKTGAGNATREDYDRAGKSALWQVAIVLLVCVVVAVLAIAVDS